MKIVVFGGTGFIGKVLCNELAGKNQEVISVGKRKMITSLRKDGDSQEFPIRRVSCIDREM